MENAVYQHLKFLQYEVYVGKSDTWEIDFVALGREKKVYVQVSNMISDEKTRQREYDQLLKIRDNFPKYVVSMDQIILGDVHGIHNLHLRTFLQKMVL
jgi:predicted AAA+ superfamily ATPase